MNDIQEARKRLVDELLKVIPSNINPAEFLIEALNISKVSAYRRLNCKISFTYDEIVVLTRKLNLSIDEIICPESIHKTTFYYLIPSDRKSLDLFLNVLEIHYNCLSIEVKYSDRDAISSLTYVWLIFTVGHPNLFKFYYYKWMQQWDPLFSKVKMETVELPPSVELMRIKLCEIMSVVNNSTFIYDRSIFYNTIKEFEYYYKRKLISKTELMLIIADLESIINFSELQALNGTYMNITHHYFISSRNIYSNDYSVMCNNKLCSFIFGHSVRPFKTEDQRFCKIHREWINSLKKYSAYISGSNEEVFCKFYSKQREYLRMLAEDEELIL